MAHMVFIRNQSYVPSVANKLPILFDKPEMPSMDFEVLAANCQQTLWWLCNACMIWVSNIILLCLHLWASEALCFRVVLSSVRACREWPENLHADVSWPPQNWLDYGHGLLFSLLLVSLWLSETGKILCFRAFPRERMVGMAWNFACWCILSTFITD